MEVETSYKLLFQKWSCENTDLILPLIRKCLSLSPSEKEVLRALELALCFCLRCVSIDDLENEVYELVFPAAKNVVSEKLKQIEHNPVCWFESLTVSLRIMSFLEKVFQYLNENGTVSIGKVKSFLLATAETMLVSFTHCKVSKKVYGDLFKTVATDLSTFFRKCCALQKQLLNCLMERIECSAEDKEETEFLSLIMTSLSKLGFILITLETKTMVEVWKGFIFLANKHIACLKRRHNIGETVKELCSTITANVSIVLCNDGQDICKVIKLSCFFLKLIIKFCEMFTGCLKNCHASLLNLLLKFYKWDATVGDKEVQATMNDLIVGTEPLLVQLMTDDDFIGECCYFSKAFERSPEFSILCCSVLKKLLDSNSETRKLWFNGKKNILECIFNSASSNRIANHGLYTCTELPTAAEIPVPNTVQDRVGNLSAGQFITYSNISLPSIIVNGKPKKFTDLYEYVLVTSSAFLMTATVEEYQLAEETLVKSVLQLNPIRALLAIDIWCILARFADSELCFSQLLTLSKVFQEFSSGSFRVEKWHLASLIQRLLPLLTEAQKTAFLKSVQPSFYASLWEGSKLHGLTSKETCDVCEALLGQVDQLVDGVMDSYCAKTLPTLREGIMNEKFGGKILKLWQFDCEILSATPQSVRFLKIACALTACIVSSMLPADLLRVLTQMNRLLALGQPTCTKLYFTWVLNPLALVCLPPGETQKKIVVAIAEIFKNLLSTKEALVKQKALETFYTFAHRTSHTEVVSLSVQNAPELKGEITDYLKKKPAEQEDFILSNYITEVCQVKFRHACPQEQLEEFLKYKKIKLDNSDLQEIVVRWKDFGRKIVECFHLLSWSEKEEIQSLCNSILSLTE